MRLHELTAYLENIAPLRFQEDYDNAGLICGDPNEEIRKIVVSLDCTVEVIEEAVSLGANVVISHHPIIFKGIRKFNTKNYVDQSIIAAIKNDIAIYAIHTNLDNVLENGVNQKIAQKLQLKDLTLLRPQVSNRIEADYAVGSGVLGHLDKKYDGLEFLSYLKNCMGLKLVKHTKLLDRKIQKIAVCGGSGSFLLPAAIESGADVYISADFKYHEFFDANNQIVIADIGHYESEYFTIELLYELITKKFPNFAPHCTKMNTNPVEYF